MLSCSSVIWDCHLFEQNPFQVFQSHFSLILHSFQHRIETEILLLQAFLQMHSEKFWYLRVEYSIWTFLWNSEFLSMLCGRIWKKFTLIKENHQICIEMLFWKSDYSGGNYHVVCVFIVIESTMYLALTSRYKCMSSDKTIKPLISDSLHKILSPCFCSCQKITIISRYFIWCIKRFPHIIQISKASSKKFNGLSLFPSLILIPV